MTNTEIGSGRPDLPQHFGRVHRRFSPGVGIVLDQYRYRRGQRRPHGDRATGTAASPAGASGEKPGADGSMTSGHRYLPQYHQERRRSTGWTCIGLTTRLSSAANVHGFLLADSVVGPQGPRSASTRVRSCSDCRSLGGANGLQGVGTIRNSLVSGGVQDNIAFHNQSGSMALTIDNTTGLPGRCRVSSNSPTTGRERACWCSSKARRPAASSLQQCLLRGNRSAGGACRRRAAPPTSRSPPPPPTSPTPARGIDGVVLSNADDASVTAHGHGQHLLPPARAAVSGSAQAAAAASAGPQAPSDRSPATRLERRHVGRVRASPRPSAALSGQAATCPTPARPRTPGSRSLPAARRSSITTPNAGTSPLAAHHHPEQPRGHEGSARVCRRARADRTGISRCRRPSRPPTSAPTSWGTPRTGRPGHQSRSGWRPPGRAGEAAPRSGWSAGPKRC